MDWFLWRLLTSPRMSLVPRDLDEMSLVDALEANMALDIHDALEARANEAARE